MAWAFQPSGGLVGIHERLYDGLVARFLHLVEVRREAARAGYVDDERHGDDGDHGHRRVREREAQAQASSHDSSSANV